MPQGDTPQAQLQFQLDAITNHTRALVPPERLRRSEELVEHLLASGQQEHLLPVGATVAPFALRAATGKEIHLTDLLALGPVVLKFFRGRWDPYDITELEALERIQPALRSQRALLVGICPQTVRQNAFTVDQHHLTFPILSDPRCEVAETFRLAYTVPSFAQAHYRSMLVNLPLMNGDESWRLPLPATYVLSSAGSVLLAKGFADHRRRPDPEELLAVLPPVARTR